MAEAGKFTVDTHLFRELGELLVGRDSTALIELIKNAYDADATEVVVLGQELDNPGQGSIVITDNGLGMTPEQFRLGFLRVASRMKDDGNRRSERLKRRYTGAKGIGRLAAHKLAKVVQVDSTAAADDGHTRQAVSAKIDWDKVEAFETLEDLSAAKDSDAVVVNMLPADDKAKTGTVLRLSRLRRAWTPTERARFFSEVQSFKPPEFLTKAIRKSVVSDPMLFEEPLVRLAEADGQSFSVALEGDFASGDEYWRLMEDHASWVLEIRCRPGDTEVSYAIAPTRRLLREIPDAEPYSTSLPHPDPENGPFFDARIFVRTGVLKGKTDQRTWASNASGVRVFMEGFRVLPYGEPRNDWLKLDSDYTKRTRTLDTLQEWGLDDLGAEDDKDRDLGLFPNNNLFGAVFLVHEYTTNLRTLVNREGFVPEEPYDHLVLLVRTGVDLCIRANAAATYERRQERKQRRSNKETPTGSGRMPEERGEPTTKPERRREALEDATAALAEARSALATTTPDGQSTELSQKLERSMERLHEQLEETDDFISELALLRVLASIGTQMSAFVHEIRALLGTSQAIERALAAILVDTTLADAGRLRLAQVEQAVGDLRRGLEREASYLTDIVAPDARRRRSRQRFSERFDVARRLLGHHAERVGIRIENGLPDDLKSPPMFPAELTAVFTNLLSNAVKAAGPGGYVYAKGSQKADDSVHVVVQNTGARVDLAEGERWFRPFESTTANVNPGMGQGMGLGLPITRRLLDDYGAEIKFIKPDPQFSTAVEIIFPESR
jgi:signal transduction histidine kinase